MKKNDRYVLARNAVGQLIAQPIPLRGETSSLGELLESLESALTEFIDSPARAEYRVSDEVAAQLIQSAQELKEVVLECKLLKE